MKTLAAVNVFFLPGTFVATLFSMPLLDLRGESPSMTADFWIYWAVTVPLTVLTVLYWLLWTHKQKTLQRDQEKEAQDALTDDLKGKGVVSASLEGKCMDLNSLATFVNLSEDVSLIYLLLSDCSLICCTAYVRSPHRQRVQYIWQPQCPM